MGELESVTVTVKLEVPVEVGVPEITPDDVLINNPAGNEPAVMLKLYGVVPPVAATEAV